MRATPVRSINAWVWKLGLLACAACIGQAAFAQSSPQNWPVRPLRVLVPYPAGGGGDAVARMIAQPLSESLGQPVIVDNRGGAGGLVAAELLAKAVPDGYTLLLGDAGSIAVSRAAGKLPYDPAKEFTPVSLIGSSTFMLVVAASASMQSVKDLIADAKSKPGQLTFASAGTYTAPHMAGELFKYLAQVKILHVPYKGGAPAITSVVAGESNMYFSSTPAAAGQIKAGRLRAIGVTGSKRKPEFPDVPAIGEIVPGYEVGQWYGVFAPGNTPAATVSRLQSEIASALRKPDVQKRLAGNGVEVASARPQDFAPMIRKEVEMWSKVIKQAGIQSN